MGVVGEVLRGASIDGDKVVCVEKGFEARVSLPGGSEPTVEVSCNSKDVCTRFIPQEGTEEGDNGCDNAWLSSWWEVHIQDMQGGAIGQVESEMNDVASQVWRGRDSGS